MKKQFKYGSDVVSFDINDSAETLSVKNPENVISKDEFINSLARLIEGKNTESVGIVVSDKTRLCGYNLYLPWITEFLVEKGIRNSQITFYIAYGTHPKQTTEECIAAYGDVYNKYRFVHHDCTDNEALLQLRHTKLGTPVSIRRSIFRQDLLILMGAISHHYFAGFGGGRKLLFPGLGGRDAIYSNHKLFIDFEKKQLHPGCQAGKLDENPIAMDLEEIDTMLPEKIIISGILDTSGKVSKLMFSSSYDEFTEACKVYDNHYRYNSDKKYDLVISCSGGYPKDINFIQTHKSLHNAASFVKDGGNLILLGECRDGMGNASFLGLFHRSKEDMIDELSVKYSGNGGTALSLLSKTERISVNMVTSLSEDTCKILGIVKLDIEGAASLIDKSNGSIAIIENASIIYT